METKKLLSALITIGIIALFSTSAIAQGYSYQKDEQTDSSYPTPLIRVFTPDRLQTTANVYVDDWYYGTAPTEITIDKEKTITIKPLDGYKECTVIMKPDSNNKWTANILDNNCILVVNRFRDSLDLYLYVSSTTTTTLPPSTGYTYQSVRTVKVTPKNIRVNVGTTKFRINKNTGTVTRKTGTAWNYKKTATITGNLISAKLKGTQVTLNKNTGRILYTKKA